MRTKLAILLCGMLVTQFDTRAAASDPALNDQVTAAIARGLAWLKTNQAPDGSWSMPDAPAVTALALTAFQGAPKAVNASADTELRKGYAFLLGCVQADGGIHKEKLVTYNTSISMLALAAANDPQYAPTLRNARQFLIGLQGDFGEKGQLDSPFDGGIGYGTKYEHSDMGNTLQALEAIYRTRHLQVDSPGAKDLNWTAAIHFLQNCQNLPGVNKQAWVSDDAKDKGGFVYYPGGSMAGGVTNSVTGRIALRSYGSISYGGLLSYIYADMKRDDARVRAVFDWLRKNFTLEENPGMGPQGLYFYFHTMAKALSLYGVDELELADGAKVRWREALAKRVLSMQNADGSWINESNRWWEKDAALVTSYAVLTLEVIANGKPPGGLR